MDTDTSEREPEQPKTAEALLALPEGGGFGMRIETRPDGRRVRYVIAPDLMVFFPEPDTVVACVDADGGTWRLVRDASGQYFRRRY